MCVHILQDPVEFVRTATYLAVLVLLDMCSHTAIYVVLSLQDPIEFVRTIYDVMEDYTSQRVQCARLLVDLCQKRPSGIYMKKNASSG